MSQRPPSSDNHPPAPHCSTVVWHRCQAGHPAAWPAVIRPSSGISAINTAAIDLEVWISWAIAIATLMAILGHSRSIWIQFTGGKSAATRVGVRLAMSWQVGLGVAICFAAVLALWRIVSLSSISAALTAITLRVIFRQPAAFVLMAIVGAAYVIFRHKANIQRLLAGTEPRIGQSRKARFSQRHQSWLAKFPQKRGASSSLRSN
ncbi:glycerol-3-phosphate acyltransferase [Labrys portucalensis]|uniref:Glycerol-3-phosphate acyltransferase n=1 Tax=Labrys neptuniae TaxID=376174 RepID=A0ABV6ZS57_9HYPH